MVPLCVNVSGSLRQPILPDVLKSVIDPFRNTPTCTTNETMFGGRSGVIDETYRWTDFNVHPDKAFTTEERRTINDAMYYLWQVIPCVNFGIWHPDTATPTGDYVRIIKGTDNGCSAAVGRRGGRQDMNLQSPGCMGIGTVMHELIHALGFYHEHSRPDRSQHVFILYENIVPGLEHAFDVFSPSRVTTFNIPYDQLSIMHYPAYAFSRNGQPTISAKNGKAVGSLGLLRDSDKAKLKAMYKC